jgi:hypothetical protein
MAATIAVTHELATSFSCVPSPGRSPTRVAAFWSSASGSGGYGGLAGAVAGS